MKSTVEETRKGTPGKKPGSPKTGGRVKGTPNKVTAALKDMILGALDAKGGQAYLERQAEENPTAFMTLIGKVLPTTLVGDPDAPVQHIARIELVALK